MRSVKRTGRIIGALLLVQLAGLIFPFNTAASIKKSVGLSGTRCGRFFQIRLAVLLLLANAVLTIGITVAALPGVNQHSINIASAQPRAGSLASRI